MFTFRKKIPRQLVKTTSEDSEENEVCRQPQPFIGLFVTACTIILGLLLHDQYHNFLSSRNVGPLDQVFLSFVAISQVKQMNFGGFYD